MREAIVRRTLACAQYIVDHQITLRQAARVFGIGKSTVHTDMTVRLPRLDGALAKDVQEVLARNHAERHLRGGESTRRKYQHMQN